MRNEPWLEALREAVRKFSEKPDDEIWDEMVRDGIIDEEGRVLIRMPEPPKKAKKPGRKPGKRSDKNDEKT